MPQDFAQGKVYAIQSMYTDDLYVGSTAYPLLCQRWRQHAYAHRKGLAPRLSGLLSQPDVHIELLEAWPCESRSQLRAREQHWLDVLQQDYGVPLLNTRRAQAATSTCN